MVGVLGEIDFSLLDLIQEVVLSFKESLEFFSTIVLLAEFQNLFNSSGVSFFKSLVQLRSFNDILVSFQNLTHNLLDADFLLLLFEDQVAGQ